MALKSLGNWFYSNQLEMNYLKLTGEAFQELFCNIMEKNIKRIFQKFVRMEMSATKNVTAISPLRKRFINATPPAKPN